MLSRFPAFGRGALALVGFAVLLVALPARSQSDLR
jgi:hypothetical protein